MKSQSGSDLFGNTGQYSHNKSDPVKVSLETSSAILKIYLNGRPINSLDGSSVVETYFKVTGSEPTTQKVPLVY